MSIEPEIKQAIEESVTEMGQSDSVLRQIIAWLEAISNNKLSDRDQAQRLELIYDAIKVEKNENSYED
ncbi:CxC ATPase DNA modification system associated small protein [Crocosphaera sp. XPORK-15E]|uniref:CxC ATPase DNA modification system associated small protein n=1 Tax=Crocosphaera sp. XPORK-15E TaxID=3110247 RepID=UPI002B1F9788|nr:CxC ATPase DNA modification system associated small protein [Crocosphaera sp. XPORK-15E]MEA5533731.1 CxC ATPase DNA modification system associated small protein [Crocosphaera sp. XPORK-15E]